MTHESEYREPMHSENIPQQNYVNIVQFFQRLNSDVASELYLPMKRNRLESKSDSTEDDLLKAREYISKYIDTFEFPSSETNSPYQTKKSDDFADLLDKFTSEEIDRRLEAADEELAQIEL